MKELKNGVQRLQEAQEKRQQLLDEIDIHVANSMKTMDEIIAEVEKMKQEMQQEDAERIANETEKLKKLFVQKGEK